MITSNLGLNLPDFDVSPWHDLVNNNFKILDSIVHTMFGLTNVKGVYANSTAVAVGDRYIDSVTTEMWEVVTGYVTEPAPTLFSADRALHPSNWLLVDANAALNGLAQMLTLKDETVAAQVAAEAAATAAANVAATLQLPALAHFGSTPQVITDWDNAKNYPNTVVYAASAASLLPSGFEYNVAGSPGRAGLGFYYSLDANNGYIIIIALASGNRWDRRYEGGIWQNWSRPPNKNEVVNRGFSLTGNAEGIIDTLPLAGADFYKVAAGASNLPTWAALNDTILVTAVSTSDGSLTLFGRNGRIATKAKNAGVWGAWVDQSLLSETVRKGLTIGGDLNTLVAAGNAGFTDVYNLTAGFSNAPTGAAVGDKLINMCIDATNGMQIAVTKAGGSFIRTCNAGTWTAWIDETRKRFISALTTYANGNQLTIAHGLGAVPNNISVFAVCQTAQSIITVGQRISLVGQSFTSIWADATNIKIQISNNGISFNPDGVGANQINLTAANFKILAIAEL